MDIIDYPNYIIDRDGVVKNKKTNKIISIHLSRGYKYVMLWKDGKQKLFKLHRLLALHFIPNPENKECIDHINRDKLDNNLFNLRWATYQENCLNKNIPIKDLPKNIRLSPYNKYEVIIKRNYITCHIGSFNTLEEAIIARDKALE
jgi:hypothetical protein